MAWTIEYTTSVRKTLKKLDPYVAKKIVGYIKTRIAPLKDPHNAGSPLVENFKNLWRFRCGDYRIICEIQDEVLCILVVEVGHRKDIYH